MGSATRNNQILKLELYGQDKKIAVKLDLLVLKTKGRNLFAIKWRDQRNAAKLTPKLQCIRTAIFGVELECRFSSVTVFADGIPMQICRQ